MYWSIPQSFRTWNMDCETYYATYICVKENFSQTRTQFFSVKIFSCGNTRVYYTEIRFRIVPLEFNTPQPWDPIRDAVSTQGAKYWCPDWLR